MTTHDLYLLSPELSMVGLATVLLLLDLVMARKSLILGLGVVGLIVPLGFTVALWFTVGDDAAAENTGVLAGTLVEQGAEAIIAGCTEIPLVLSEGELPVPVISSTRALARATVAAAVAESR